MSRILWILLALLLGTILAGCARDRLTISAYAVQYIDNEPVELKIEYEIK